MTINSFQGNYTAICRNVQLFEERALFVSIAVGTTFRVKEIVGADALPELLMTPLIIDGRNQYSPPAMKSMGFEYVCVERC
jgi:hypothetical protein